MSQTIEYASHGKMHPAILEVKPWNTGNKYYSIHFISNEYGHLVSSNYNIFDALCSLRGVLESFECLICCNGSRLNTWASRMGKDMGGGKEIYITHHGVPANASDRVPTLGPAEYSECATLSAQLEYHIQWMYSLLNSNVTPSDKVHVPRQIITESTWNANGVVYKIDGTFDAETMDPNTFPESVLGHGSWTKMAILSNHSHQGLSCQFLKTLIHHG